MSPFSEHSDSRPKRRGLSLVEAVVALFVFVAGALASFELALSACQDAGRVENLTQASLIGENVLDAIRNWAYIPDHYRTQWAIYDNQDIPIPDQPTFRVHTYLAPDQRNPISPCSQLLVGLPSREITNSSRVVHVKVAWGKGGFRDSLDICATVNEPARNVRGTNPVVLTRLPPLVDPVAVNTTTRFQAALYDIDDQAIEGLHWEWLCVSNWDTSQGGMGTMLDVPNQAMGAQIDLLHHFYRGDPDHPIPPHKMPGAVVARASCVYDGVPYSLDSQPVQLAP